MANDNTDDDQGLWSTVKGWLGAGWGGIKHGAGKAVGWVGGEAGSGLKVLWFDIVYGIGELLDFFGMHETGQKLEAYANAKIAAIEGHGDTIDLPSNADFSKDVETPNPTRITQELTVAQPWALPVGTIKVGADGKTIPPLTKAEPVKAGDKIPVGTIFPAFTEIPAGTFAPLKSSSGNTDRKKPDSKSASQPTVLSEDGALAEAATLPVGTILPGQTVMAQGALLSKGLTLFSDHTFIMRVNAKGGLEKVKLKDFLVKDKDYTVNADGNKITLTHDFAVLDNTTPPAKDSHFCVYLDSPMQLSATVTLPAGNPLKAYTNIPAGTDIKLEQSFVGEAWDWVYDKSAAALTSAGSWYISQYQKPLSSGAPEATGGATAIGLAVILTKGLDFIAKHNLIWSFNGPKVAKMANAKHGGMETPEVETPYGTVTPIREVSAWGNRSKMVHGEVLEHTSWLGQTLSGWYNEGIVQRIWSRVSGNDAAWRDLRARQAKDAADKAAHDAAIRDTAKNTKDIADHTRDLAGNTRETADNTRETATNTERTANAVDLVNRNLGTTNALLTTLQGEVGKLGAGTGGLQTAVSDLKAAVDRNSNTTDRNTRITDQNTAVTHTNTQATTVLTTTMGKLDAAVTAAAGKTTLLGSKMDAYTRAVNDLNSAVKTNTTSVQDLARLTTAAAKAAAELKNAQEQATQALQEVKTEAGQLRGSLEGNKDATTALEKVVKQNNDLLESATTTIGKQIDQLKASVDGASKALGEQTSATRDNTSALKDRTDGDADPMAGSGKPKPPGGGGGGDEKGATINPPTEVSEPPVLTGRAGMMDGLVTPGVTDPFATPVYITDTGTGIGQSGGAVINLGSDEHHTADVPPLPPANPLPKPKAVTDNASPDAPGGKGNVQADPAVVPHRKLSRPVIVDNHAPIDPYNPSGEVKGLNLGGGQQAGQPHIDVVAPNQKLDPAVTPPEGSGHQVHYDSEGHEIRDPVEVHPVEVRPVEVRMPEIGMVTDPSSLDQARQLLTAINFTGDNLVPPLRTPPKVSSDDGPMGVNPGKEGVA